MKVFALVLATCHSLDVLCLMQQVPANLNPNTHPHSVLCLMRQMLT